MSPPALLFRDVTVRYEAGLEAVLAGVSLSIGPGERTALLGLNGSGKTTLLKAAVGLVPHDGAIEVGGVPLDRQSLSSIRDQVGFLFNVPEDQLLFPRVIDDVAFGLLRRGAPAADASAKARRALDALGVGAIAESSVHDLSHGQKLRVALAGAVATDPPLLLLDEPSAGLDPPGRRALARLLEGVGAAMLIATHDLELAERVCSRCLLLEGGRIELDGAATADIVRRW